jgi:prevent-host-death family protein
MLFIRRLIMGSWPVHDAKARFTESLNTTLKKDPQIVTRRGIQIAVLVPIEDWRRLEQNARPGLKALLLGDKPEIGADAAFDQIRSDGTKADSN